MVEKAILKALQKAATNAVAASTLSTLAVKYVGMAFTKPANAGWLELVHIPNNIENDNWGMQKTYRGMLNFILHWPMDAKGAYDPIDLLESIGDHFPKGVKFAGDGGVTVKILEMPNFKGIMEETPEMLLPMVVKYEFFAA